MRILRLYLLNRKRLSGYKSIDIDLTDEKHLVLGDNGSGKTNFLSELSALPPDQNNYGPNGQKSIWFELDNGTIIEFTSYPNQKKHHEVFINDDRTKNINISGTVTEQKELAKAYTGITPEFFELLVMGIGRFTETKAAYRRDLFNRINTTNYEYALKLYQKVRDGYKNEQAVIKHLMKQLSFLENKKINDDVIEEMEARLRNLDEEISIWLDLKKKHLRKPNAIRSEIASLINENKQCLKRLGKRFDKIEDDLSDVTSTKERIASINGTIKNMREQIAQYSSAIADKKKLVVFDNAKRQAAMIELDRLINEFTKIEESKYAAKEELKTHELESKEYYKKYFGELLNVFSKLPENSDHDLYAGVDYQETLHKLESSIKENKETIITIGNEIKHYENHIDKDKVVCPSCSFNFVPMLGNVNIEKINTLFNEHLIIEKELITAYEQVLAKHESLLEARETMNDFIKLLNKDSVLSSVFSIVGRKINLLELMRSFELEHARRDLISKITRIEQELKMHTEFDSERERIIKEEISHMNEILNNLHKKLFALTEENNNYTNYLRELNKRINDINELELALSKISLLENELNVSVTNTFIETHLGELTQKRSELYTSVEAARNNSRDRINTANEIALKEKGLVIHASLIKALSPVDGIIAEGMTGFINKFISDMNLVIKHNWEDRLVINTCKMEAGAVDLDYLFSVETMYENPPDVSLCSKGEKEIIDLAFREVAMKYVGLSTHPILFDEWSVNMDDAHRQKACELLGTLTDRTMHSQVIVASHLKSVHDALGIVKRFALSTKNITVNGEYNTHVKMTR